MNEQQIAAAPPSTWLEHAKRPIGILPDLTGDRDIDDAGSWIGMHDIFVVGDRHKHKPDRIIMEVPDVPFDPARLEHQPEFVADGIGHVVAVMDGSLLEAPANEPGSSEAHKVAPLVERGDGPPDPIPRQSTKHHHRQFRPIPSVIAEA